MDSKEIKVQGSVKQLTIQMVDEQNSLICSKSKDKLGKGEKLIITSSDYVMEFNAAVSFYSGKI